MGNEKRNLGAGREVMQKEQILAVQGDYITLGQLLKVAGVVGTGGAAKYYLAGTSVQVNGEPEQRRGRKLRPGDVVAIPGGPTLRLVAENSLQQFGQP